MATVTSQLLNAIRTRKFSSLSKMFAPGVDFQAWTNLGHWTAADGPTVVRIIETWFSPGAGAMTVVDSHESAGARGAATLEFEMAWTVPPDDQPRVLRQIYLLTIKGDRIAQARIYCPGPHTDFPEVDLDKQRRAKGLQAPIVKPTAKQAAAMAAKIGT